MARKLSMHDSAPGTDSRVAHLKRLVGSLQYPLSPEGERVLAAAKVGLKLIRKDMPEKKAPKSVKTIQRPSAKVVEENLPESIREMLVLHRQRDNNDHPTQPLRPDRA